MNLWHDLLNTNNMHFERDCGRRGRFLLSKRSIRRNRIAWCFVHDGLRSRLKMRLIRCWFELLTHWICSRRYTFESPFDFIIIENIFIIHHEGDFNSLEYLFCLRSTMASFYIFLCLYRTLWTDINQIRLMMMMMIITIVSVRLLWLTRLSFVDH